MFCHCLLIVRYLSLLMELTQTFGSRAGHVIRDQLLDVVVRVTDIRSLAVQSLIDVLEDSTLREKVP